MEDNTMTERLTELHFKNDIGLYYCGRRVNTPNHTYGSMVRNHYLFVLVDKGKAVMLSHKRLSFGEHDLLIMQPNERIHYEALEPWSICWLGLYGETVSTYIDLLNMKTPVIHISLYYELKAIMDHIYDLAKDTALPAKLTVMGLIYEFFSVLLKNESIHDKTELADTAKK